MDTEEEVSASEFRIYMKMLGNRVSTEQLRVIVSRHGRPLFAVVSEEDLEFLRKHRPHPKPAPVDALADGADYVPRRLPHPDSMKFEEVQRIYAATTNRIDPETHWWRMQAYVVIRARTGKYPEIKPLPSRESG